MAPVDMPLDMPIRSSNQSRPTLDGFAFEETTPSIGREYPHVNLVDDVLNAPNADELVHDLAVTSRSIS